MIRCSPMLFCLFHQNLLDSNLSVSRSWGWIRRRLDAGQIYAITDNNMIKCLLWGYFESQLEANSTAQNTSNQMSTNYLNKKVVKMLFRIIKEKRYCIFVICILDTLQLTHWCVFHHVCNQLHGIGIKNLLNDLVSWDVFHRITQFYAQLVYSNLFAVHEAFYDLQCNILSTKIELLTDPFMDLVFDFRWSKTTSFITANLGHTTLGSEAADLSAKPTE